MELSAGWLGTLRMSDTLRATRLDRLLLWATWRVEVNSRGQNILRVPDILSVQAEFWGLKRGEGEIVIREGDHDITSQGHSS